MKHYACQSELTETKAELERDREENEIINKQNEDLLELLGAIEDKVDKLSCEVAAKREGKEVRQAEFDRVTAEHVAVLDRIIKECRSKMARMNEKQSEALDKFKKETSQNVCNSSSRLKMNILFHTQVACGPFNARKVDFGALYDVDMDKLGFDVCFPSSAALDVFLEKWRSS
ncbi:hypothetical protein PVK06_002664 [Gossypium arboreum]|uniref:Uncharacterized protein n=1 Tax=Gossypium arboreum TaxID=29729 RepID=A0ABR0R5A5_GOSAR|nr:hypothetical protein PVK06_002664 [Gossypium arboreum]